MFLSLYIDVINETKPKYLSTSKEVSWNLESQQVPERLGVKQNSVFQSLPSHWGWYVLDKNLKINELGRKIWVKEELNTDGHTPGPASFCFALKIMIIILVNPGPETDDSFMMK